MRWRIVGNWYCATPHPHQCDSPGQLNLSVHSYVPLGDFTASIFLSRAELRSPGDVKQENMAEIGKNCQFRPEVPQDYYVLQDHLGALVIGPVDQGLVVFINDEKRILNFPVRICEEGKITIANNKNLQPIWTQGQSGSRQPPDRGP